MRKNVNARPASQGNDVAANMPANNVGTHSTSLGSTHSSSFKKAAHNPRSIVGQGMDKPTTPNVGGDSGPVKGGSKMPTNNSTDKKVALGHTKHGVGEVPGYLRGHK